MNNFGMRLRALRKETGLTQQQVSDALGVPLRKYSYWESREQPPVEACEKLVPFYKTTADYLLGFSSNPHREVPLSTVLSVLRCQATRIVPMRPGMQDEQRAVQKMIACYCELHLDDYIKLETGEALPTPRQLTELSNWHKVDIPWILRNLKP